MSIFNSLGSNYDFRFVLNSLFVTNDDKYHNQLINFLENKYRGKAVLVYKGREALRLALKLIRDSGPSNSAGRQARMTSSSVVAICGFTCFAVYDAIVKERYKVEYLDIEKDSLNFSFETLKKHVEKNPQIKIVVIQNTLGNPCDIEKISAFCKEKKIILIEDLAHSIGAIYENKREAGTVGDFTVLSFSQDKVVDGVSGGAVVVRNDQYQISNIKYQKVDKNKQIIDRLYPLFTFLIRKTYKFGVGKAVHLILKNLRLLSNPMNDSKNIYGLPNWYCSLIFKQFKSLEEDIVHRKRIAKIYFEKLDKKILGFDFDIEKSVNLRSPILVENRGGLIKSLKDNNIFVSDIWYDAPIAPKKYLHKTNYKNECHESEKISSQILNLPTHKNVSEKDAEYISKKINQWIKK